METNKQTAPGVVLGIRDEIVCKKIGNVYAILDLRTGAFYTLNEIAGLLWNLIKEQMTIDDICTHIMQQYDISHNEVMQDINAFIEFFTKEQLLIY